MVLDPLVAVLGAPIVVVDILVALDLYRFSVCVKRTLVRPSEQRERRSQLQREGNIRSLTRENLLVGRSSGQTDGIADIVGDTVIEDEVVAVPVTQPVHLPAKGVVKHEPVIRPFQTVTDTGGQTEDLHLPVVATDVPCQVRVCLTGIVSRQTE